MATGRGWIKRQLRELLETREDAARGGAKPTATRAGFGRGISQVNVKRANPIVHGWKSAGVQKHLKSPLKASTSLDRLPSEILLKILSYLDPGTLLCMGCACKSFYLLCNDNVLWYRIYSSVSPPITFNGKPKSVENIIKHVSHTTIQEKDHDYWKKQYIAKMITADKNGIMNLLKPINPYTGLLANTKEAVTSAGLIWVITLKDTFGKEYVIEQVDISFNDTSLTVFWYGAAWPCLGSLKTLQLHGVTAVFRDRNRLPRKNGPRRRSLIAEYDLANLKDSSILIGCDKLVKVFRLNPGLLLGLWRTGSGIAFVMASLHYHHLLQRSTMGSANMQFVFPAHKPVLDDIDSQYGLHDYQLHIDIHSGRKTYLCGSFRHLYCKKDYIRNGFLKLTVISPKNNKQHATLAGKIGLLWKTDAFHGNVQNCFMMDVTVLDETEKPFWCVSAPVNIQTSPSDSLYDFLGQHFVLNYNDLEGKVHMELVWMKETEEYCIINLVLHLSTAKVNSWFGTDY